MGNLDKLKVKKPKPLVIDQTNVVVPDMDQTVNAAAQPMPAVTTVQSATPADPPKKSHKGRGRPKPPPVHPADQDQRGRLPHLASFHAVYHAIDRQWTGSLVVEGREFHATASGVFWLLRNLDALYRASLTPTTAPVPAEGPGE